MANNITIEREFERNTINCFTIDCDPSGTTDIVEITQIIDTNNNLKCIIDPNNENNKKEFGLVYTNNENSFISEIELKLQGIYGYDEITIPFTYRGTVINKPMILKNNSNESQIVKLNHSGSAHFLDIKYAIVSNTTDTITYTEINDTNYTVNWPREFPIPAQNYLIIQGGETMKAWYSESGKYYFSCDNPNADFILDGNVMGLLGKNITTMEFAAFEQLFMGFRGLTTIKSNFLAAEVSESGFESMFKGCTELTTVEAIPAIKFREISSNKYCYANMFEGCTSLTSVPELPAETLVYGCYDSMFKDCTNLTTITSLPATTLASNCYANMFQGCTSLTTAPELLATTLADSCYANMFQGCTSLTTAPELLATTLADSCYANMFNGCSNLNYIKMMATNNINATNCLYYWVNGVSATGTFIKDANTNILTGISGIPSGWTVS